MKTWVAVASLSLLFVSGCLVETPNPSSTPSASSRSEIPSTSSQAPASTHISATPKAPAQSTTNTTTSASSSSNPSTTTSSPSPTSNSPPVQKDFLEVQSAPYPYHSWMDVHVAVSNSSSGPDFLPNFHFALGQEATSSDRPADNQHSVTDGPVGIHEGDKVYLCGPSAKAYVILDDTSVSPSTVELTQIPECV